MKTVTFEMRSPKQAMADIARDVEAGIPDTSARIVFASEDVLAQVMTEARWAILKALRGTGGMQVHALSMRLNRDIESVEADIEALLKAGVLDGDGRQGVIFLAMTDTGQPVVCAA